MHDKPELDKAYTSLVLETLVERELSLCELFKRPFQDDSEEWKLVLASSKALSVPLLV